MTETVSGKVSQLPETWAYYLLLGAIFITLLVLATFLGVKTCTGVHTVREMRRQRREAKRRSRERISNSWQRQPPAYTREHQFSDETSLQSLPFVQQLDEGT